MRVDYISDLHIDFWVKEENPQNPKMKKQMSKYIKEIGVQEGELLVIAGDLGHIYNQDTLFLTMLKEYYKNIIIVRGNHDMYLVSKKIQKRYKFDWKERVNHYKDFCKLNDIYYLDGNNIEINGKKIGGVGMSWDKSYYERISKQKVSDTIVNELYLNTMNDGKFIFDKGDNYYVSMAYGRKYFHSTFNPFQYFEDEMNKLKKIEEGLDLMVSHYAPIVPPDIPSKHKDNYDTTFYFFEGLEEVRRIKPKKWIFGHTHVNYDFIFENTQFLCNPLGYPNEGRPTRITSIEI